MGDGSAAELGRVRIQLAKLTAELNIERAAVASCDANVRDKATNQVTWLWRERRERERIRCCRTSRTSTAAVKGLNGAWCG